MRKKRRILTNARLIALGFLAVIAMGTFLLTLPISSRDLSWTNPIDALFVATSATCVTGLASVNTAAHWSTFGHVVLLVLIQIGGLGFMTVITMVSMFTGRKVGLHEQTILMQTAGTIRRDGIMSMVKRILIGTAIFEGAGALLLSIRFIPLYGAIGIWYAVFHSISAFCNAGFDLFGNSLENFSGDPLVLLTLGFLIFIGGIGFLVWSDIQQHKLHVRKYSTHSKVALVGTLSLLMGGFLLFLLFEYNSPAFSGLSLGEKILNALFLSITPRTAGFNALPMQQLSGGSVIVTLVMMFIGGSPGSTAGGIKVTTFVLLILSAAASAHKNSEVVVFKRRIEDEAIRRASAVALIYALAAVTAILALCALEPEATPIYIAMEVVSAIGTVGLSMGMTTGLCVGSKLILSLLMFSGRVGAFTLVMALAEKAESIPLSRPKDEILIG